MHKYNDAELTLLLDELESDRVERKAHWQGKTAQKAREAVCSFANDLPRHNQAGILFIGANDDGSPSGEPITDQLLTTLAHIRDDGKILPLPMLAVEKRVLKGTEMAVVSVVPSDMPPVRYDGRIWVRIGARRAVASAQEERILNEKRTHKHLPFDLHPVPNATLADLAKRIFTDEYLPHAFAPDVIAANHRNYEEQLASCKMIVSPSDTTPTVLGLLALGKGPQAFLPGAAIQFCVSTAPNLLTR